MASIKKIKHKKVKEGDLLIVVDPTEDSVTITVGKVDYVGTYWGHDGGWFEIGDTYIYDEDEDAAIFRIKQDKEED